jgi:guanylate kinase
MQKQGIFFLLAGPSAAGKSSLLEKLQAEHPNLIKDISVTTRAPRGQERDGVDYFFWKEADFKRRLERDEFLEHAQVHQSHYYGTLKSNVEGWLNQGRDVIKDIDVQGVRQIQERMPYPASVAIFVVPPTPAALVERLKQRGTESEAQIASRLASVRSEIQALGSFEYVVINDDLQTAARDLSAIVRAEHLKRLRPENVFALAPWLEAYAGGAH